VEGVITRLTSSGRSPRLEGDIEGLIHISEIADHRIEHPKEVLKGRASCATLRIVRIDNRNSTDRLSPPQGGFRRLLRIRTL